MTELQVSLDAAVAALRAVAPGHLVAAEYDRFMLHQVAQTAADYRRMIESLLDALPPPAMPRDALPDKPGEPAVSPPAVEKPRRRKQPVYNVLGQQIKGEKAT